MVKVGCTAATTTASASSCCAKSATTTASAKASCSSKSASLVAWGGQGCTKSTAQAADIAISDLPYRKGEEVVLAGSAICGSCNLEITESCMSLFQTADGTVYRVYKTDKTKAMRTASEKNTIKIFATVRNLDGTKYLEVKSYVVI
jgi:hypothetical protein